MEELISGIRSGQFRFSPIGLPISEIGSRDELLVQLKTGINLTPEHIVYSALLLSELPSSKAIQCLAGMRSIVLDAGSDMDFTPLEDRGIIIVKMKFYCRTIDRFCLDELQQRALGYNYLFTLDNDQYFGIHQGAFVNCTLSGWITLMQRAVLNEFSTFFFEENFENDIRLWEIYKVESGRWHFIQEYTGDWRPISSLKELCRFYSMVNVNNVDSRLISRKQPADVLPPKKRRR